MKEVVLRFLPSILILCLFFFIRKTDKMDYIESSVKEYKKYNDSLKHINENLLQNITRYNDALASSDKKLARMLIYDSVLSLKIIETNERIKKIKIEYGKANNHADNFNSYELQRYFADSIRQY